MKKKVKGKKENRKNKKENKMIKQNKNKEIFLQCCTDNTNTGCVKYWLG